MVTHSDILTYMYPILKVWYVIVGIARVLARFGGGGRVCRRSRRGRRRRWNTRFRASQTLTHSGDTDSAAG